MFGQSVFESVLDRLKAEARESARHDGEPETEDGATGVRGLPAGFAGLGSGHAFASGSQAEAAYLDLTEEFAPAPIEETVPELPPAEEPPSPHLLRIDPEDVAADLGLSGHETLLELTEKRRLFARTNHPDRAPTELRDNATIRMKIANMLIDETVRRIHVRKQLGL
jgi:hypothetical protein